MSSHPIPTLNRNGCQRFEHLATIDGKLELDSDGVLPLQRERDLYLMDYILQDPSFKPTHVRRLNYCRMYLQALTLADITTPSGNYIDSAKYHGQRSPFHPSFHSINQHRPNEQ